MREELKKALLAFKANDINTCGINLFKTLNYPVCDTITDKILSPLEYENIVGQNLTAKKEEILSIAPLFAFGENSESITRLKKFDSKEEIIAGYIFLCVELKNSDYSKTEISVISKTINKTLNSPAFIIFKHGKKLTFTVTDRRINHTNTDKDVIEKTTLIKDIIYETPHTAHIRILEKISFDSLNTPKSFKEFHEKLKERLNVRELNKDFYVELSNWYFYAVKTVQFPSPDERGQIGKINISEEKLKENTSQNLIRFLTRIIFVWFLKEKGLIKEETFDEKYIFENILIRDADSTKSTYYKAILQNLFFATLNTEMNSAQNQKKRTFINNSTGGMSNDYGIHSKYRYIRFVKNNDPDLIINLFKDVPFLNGGLFECLDEVYSTKAQEKRIDMFSDNQLNEKKLIFPDQLFFVKDLKDVDLNHEYNTKGKKYKFRGLFAILNDYKFTLEENTPLEEDVALDPELLGQIFENLLASYNPETQDTARKQTGSFYTPREIVSYMVDSSLKEYIKNNIADINEEMLEYLFDDHKHDNPFDKKTSEEIVSAIYKVKILDPACGSGAFPMGILNRLVSLLGKLDPKNTQWKELKIKDIQQIGEDAEERIKEIEKVFSQDHNHENYARKLYLIENCIYGIDIQPIASQISKLRFFLSLVIEQKINYSQPNLGILTLPNLETKFVTADTLITVQKPTQTKLGQDQYEKIEKELQTIRRKYFEARTHKTKAKYRNLDEQKREELKATLEKLGFPVTQSSKIASWNPYNQNYSADFFDPEYMFGINDGFDIVIGNPPYIRQENLKNKKDTYIKVYESFNGTSDIYIAFYERGFSLLKENGILTYITSNKWTRASYGKDFRKYILEKAQIRKYIELNGIKVFESATVDTSVMQLEKSRESKDFIYCAIGGDYNLKTKLEEYISKNTIEYKKENLSEEIFTFLTSEEIKIKERIEKIGKPLKDWDISIYRGILTGYNKAFIIDGKTKEELIKKDPKNAEIIKPLLRGKDIKRYKYKFADQWLIATFPAKNIDIGNYPVLKKYLQSFGKRLEQSGTSFIDENGVKVETRKKTSNKWFETQDQIAYWQEFEKEKIIWNPVSGVYYFTYIKEKIYFNNSIFMITGQSLKYILVFMNSSYCRWSLTFYTNLVEEGQYAYGAKEKLQMVKIPDISQESQKPFEELADYILFLKDQKEYEELSSYFEQIADFMVYGLYFEQEMKDDGSYINDEVRRLMLPMNETEGSEEKLKKIETVYKQMLSNRSIKKALNDCNVGEIKTIQSCIPNNDE